jgi:hypothetical protein
VLARQSELEINVHLAPMCCLELGTIAKESNDSMARVHLERAISSEFKHYLNETIVHIRAHAGLQAIDEDDETRKRSSSIFSLLSRTETIKILE